MATLLPVLTLWQREIVRFYRQPNRVVGAIGAPFLFWLLVGSGVGRSFQGARTIEEETYLAYVFPGTLILVLLFTAIFSTISIIEDRREGFLQSVLVAPVSRGIVVLGKTLGGATLAALQAGLFLFLAPSVGIRPGPLVIIETILVLWILAIGLTGLGFVIAWRMQSIQGFHAIMNFFLLPMWVLSGALFPMAGASSWVQWLIQLNPLTYGVATVRHILTPDHPGLEGLPGLGASVLIAGVFILIIMSAASIVARGHTSGDLQ
jgi:ABC-2 type transport system permease protein